MRLKLKIIKWTEEQEQKLKAVQIVFDVQYSQRLKNSEIFIEMCACVYELRALHGYERPWTKDVRVIIVNEDNSMNRNVKRRKRREMHLERKWRSSHEQNMDKAVDKMKQHRQNKKWIHAELSSKKKIFKSIPSLHTNAFFFSSSLYRYKDIRLHYCLRKGKTRMQTRTTWIFFFKLIAS